jgi:hypothetical protein
MVSIMVVIAIVVGAGWIVWRRRGRWRMPTASQPPAGKSPAALAFEAFTRGNSC